jgi:hypothetical protein
LDFLGSRVARVDAVSSDRPSSDVDRDASDRDGGDELGEGRDGDGTVGGGTGAGAGGGALFDPPMAAWGVVTVATGVLTVVLGVGTVGFGMVTGAVGCLGVRRSCQVAFQAARACRSRSSNPFGTASVLGPGGPLNPFEASEASADARYALASAAAYGPP